MTIRPGHTVRITRGLSRGRTGYVVERTREGNLVVEMTHRQTGAPFLPVYPPEHLERLDIHAKQRA